MMRILKYELDSPQFASLLFSVAAAFTLSFHGGKTVIGVATSRTRTFISVSKLSIFPLSFGCFVNSSKLRITSRSRFKVETMAIHKTET